jgi:hypothetical protein
MVPEGMPFELDGKSACTDPGAMTAVNRAFAGASATRKTSQGAHRVAPAVHSVQQIHDANRQRFQK